jgi:hypothetical protein
VPVYSNVNSHCHCSHSRIGLIFNAEAIIIVFCTEFGLTLLLICKAAPILSVISDLRCELDEIWALPGCYGANSNNLPTFRYNLSVKYSRINKFLDFFTLEDGPDRLFRNVGKCLAPYAAQRPGTAQISAQILTEGGRDIFSMRLQSLRRAVKLVSNWYWRCFLRW